MSIYLSKPYLKDVIEIIGNLFKSKRVMNFTPKNIFSMIISFGLKLSVKNLLFLLFSFYTEDIYSI